MQNWLFFQSEADLVVHNKTAIPINDDKQVHEPFLQWEISDINPPDLVHMVYVQILQQVWTHIFRMVQPAEISFGIERFYAQFMHQTSNSLLIYRQLLMMPQICCQPPIPPCGVFHVKFIKPSHQIKILWTFAM